MHSKLRGCTAKRLLLLRASCSIVVFALARLFFLLLAAGIMDGTDKPDYDACVAIVTREALKEMVWPALLALLLPVFVGFGFKYFGAWTGRPQLGVEVVAGFMMFGTLAGLLMAMFMDNAGGAWDNAKKLIESQGAKGSEAHKAAVTGDTVGVSFSSNNSHQSLPLVLHAASVRSCADSCFFLLCFCCSLSGSVQGHGRPCAARHHHDGQCTNTTRRRNHSEDARSSSRSALFGVSGQMSTTILVMGPLFAGATGQA